MKKIFHANSNQKRAWMAVMIPDKTELNKRKGYKRQ
jgi:hypothetical protein